MPPGETADLAETQRRLLRLVTAPEGVREALREAGDGAGRSLDGWLASDARAPAALRLEVYAGAYFARLRDALREDFGALASGLGDALFHDLVTAYLLAHPPGHWSLRHAGTRLAGFLADDPVAAPFRRRAAWAADLARLETALADAFDAPDAAVLRRDELACVPPERWEALRLRFVPAARLLRLRWPADALRDAFERGEPLAAPAAPDPILLCVWRRDERVLRRAVAAPEAQLLEPAIGGARFGALCARAADVVGEEAAPATAAAWVARWIDDGLLAGASPEGEDPRAWPA